MICVVDYGAGNLRSVTNVLDVLGAEYRLVNDETAIRAADKIVLLLCCVAPKRGLRLYRHALPSISYAML